MGGDAGPLADGDDLTDGVSHTLGLVANMGGIDAVVAADYLAEFDEFFERGIGPRSICQAGGKTDGPILHGLRGQLLHLVHFRGRRRTVVIAHGSDADIAVADQCGYVGADALVFEAPEVFAEGDPVALQAAGHGRIERTVVEFAVAGGSGGDAAVADDLGGDPLSQTAAGAAVDQERQIGVGVSVDQSGSDKAAAGVDGAACSDLSEFADAGDAAFQDGEISGKPGAAAAVDEAGVADEDIVHGGFSCFETELKNTVWR